MMEEGEEESNVEGREETCGQPGFCEMGCRPPPLLSLYSPPISPFLNYPS